MNVELKTAYVEDVLIRLAYNSSAIEGNTITLSETISIIKDSTLPGSKSIREFYEIENHKTAFYYVIDKLAKNEKLSIEIIKNIHAKLVDRLQHDGGKYKTDTNLIAGADFLPAKPTDVPILMQQWLANTSYRLDKAKDERTILEGIAQSHVEFERVHPFSDGNGRTGRMIIMYLSLDYLDCPVLIDLRDRVRYYEVLHEQDYELLAEMLKESLMSERERSNGLIIPKQ